MKHPKKKKSGSVAGASWLVALALGSGGMTAALKNDYDRMAARQQPAVAVPAPTKPPPPEPDSIPPCAPGAELLPPEDEAPTTLLGTVTVTELNVRATPNSNVRNNIIGQARSGEQIDVLEQRPDGWLKVKTKDGRTGYVAARFVTIAAAAPPPPARKTSVEIVFPCLPPGAPWCDAPNPPPARISPPQTR